ncbi:MAG: hypothetical protein ACO1Q7_11905 [Gemmatimonas sp.]
MRLNRFPTLALGTIALLSSQKADAQKADPRPIPEQIAAAVLPLPEEMRAGAGVLGYKTAGKVELLRPSKNGMMCLGNDPMGGNFHVACYHDSMEPFMKRGRELRESGVGGTQVDTVRFAEVKAGKIKMPTFPASLYQLNGPKGDFNPATGQAPNARPTYVVYIPFATSESTGLPLKGGQGRPWIMYPGTPKAHIMITGTM